MKSWLVCAIFENSALTLGYPSSPLIRFQHLLAQADGLRGPHQPSPPHPSAKRRASHTSSMRAPLKLPTRCPSRACLTVSALCRLTAHRMFIPSPMSRITSEGTPRTVEVMGAMVTVARWGIALPRVSTNTGRCLCGGGNRHNRMSPLIRSEATMPLSPKQDTPLPVADVPSTHDGPALPTPVHGGA